MGVPFFTWDNGRGGKTRITEPKGRKKEANGREDNLEPKEASIPKTRSEGTKHMRWSSWVTNRRASNRQRKSGAKKKVQGGQFFWENQANGGRPRRLGYGVAKGLFRVGGED